MPNSTPPGARDRSPRPRSRREPPSRLNPRDATLDRIAARTIESGRLIPPGSFVLAAVSGGADSVALLHVLAQSRARGGPPAELAAAHVNHGLRGAASDEDAAFVRDLARRWSIPFFERAMAAGALRPRGTGTRALAPEAEARRLRYAALRDLARESGAGMIATAHTADDQAETVLFRMVRGSGLRGLAGMAPKSRLGGARIVRPLLDATRAQVLAYLERHGVPFREDESNECRDAARNYLRHEVIPRLRERLNPALGQALVRQAGLFREADEYLEREARRLLPEAVVSEEPGKIVLDAARLVLYPKLLRSYVFRIALRALDGAAREITAAHLDALHSLATRNRGRKADLPMGIQARRERGRVVVTAPNQEPGGPNARPRLETLGVLADFRKGTPSS